MRHVVLGLGTRISRKERIFSNQKVDFIVELAYTCLLKMHSHLFASLLTPASSLHALTSKE